MALSDYLNTTADLYAPRQDLTGMVKVEALDLKAQSVRCRLLPKGGQLQRDAAGRESGGVPYREMLPLFVFPSAVTIAAKWEVRHQGNRYRVETVETMAGLNTAWYQAATCRLLV